MILEHVAVVPGIDGRKMSKSYGNTIRMFAPAGEIKKAVMGIVTDSTPVDQPKDVTTALFQLWSLFASADEREALFARAKAGGLGYGEVKKDLLARLTAHFEPLRARREEWSKRGHDVEDVLRDGARRARAIATSDARSRTRRRGPRRGPKELVAFLRPDPGCAVAARRARTRRAAGKGWVNPLS